MSAGRPRSKDSQSGWGVPESGFRVVRLYMVFEFMVCLRQIHWVFSFEGVYRAWGFGRSKGWMMVGLLLTNL